VLHMFSHVLTYTLNEKFERKTLTS